MTLLNITPRLFVTDYASYNSGKQFEHGKWIDLSDFDNADEFNEHLKEHFEAARINDPEIMFTDFEDFPKRFYSESYDTKLMEELYGALPILDAIEGMSAGELVSLHNTYCSEQGNGDEIFTFDEDFFDTYFEGKPMEAARATSFGNVNWSDEYIKFDGYANLQSLNDYNVKNEIDLDAIIEAAIENPSIYGF